jgi:hypothetical protein
MTKRGAATITGLWLATVVLLGETPAHPRNEQNTGDANRSIRADVAWALAVALEKLGNPSCRLIFSDFEDSDGHTLQSNLESRGETGADLMRRLTYRDGTGEGPCRNDGVLAFTTPGAPAIFICARGFRRALREHRDLAANILLHEGLHCLGLEELSRFVPVSSDKTSHGRRLLTSLEITEHVAARCGS